LAESLTANNTLERLNIADNKLGDISLACLLPALRGVDSSLKVLNLQGNHIGTKGATELAAALRHHQRLEKINLAGNHAIGNQAYQELELCLQHNYTIKHLWLPTTTMLLSGSMISCYLKLNKLDRKQLMGEHFHNSDLWAQAILGCADDLECVYYLVRANPAVVVSRLLLLNLT
jgi:Ran GTPase-activating protein (RanGAP) involved in mRNA processing and transport